MMALVQQYRDLLLIGQMIPARADHDMLTRPQTHQSREQSRRRTEQDRDTHKAVDMSVHLHAGSPQSDTLGASDPAHQIHQQRDRNDQCHQSHDHSRHFVERLGQANVSDEPPYQPEDQPENDDQNNQMQ